MEILRREPDVLVNYLFRPNELSKDYDCLILPGAKNVMEDALWLGRTGWKRTIGEFAESGKRICSFNDYLEATEILIEKAFSLGAVALKNGLAYLRTLKYKKVTTR